MGYQNYAYKLGLAHHSNRHSKLYLYDMESHAFCTIGETDKAIYSPRFSPDGSTLVYLQNEIGGPHSQSCQLMKCSWDKKDILLIVDTIHSPQSEFPRLEQLNPTLSSVNLSLFYTYNFPRTSELLLR